MEQSSLEVELDVVPYKTVHILAVIFLRNLLQIPAQSTVKMPPHVSRYPVRWGSTLVVLFGGLAPNRAIQEQKQMGNGGILDNFPFNKSPRLQSAADEDGKVQKCSKFGYHRVS